MNRILIIGGGASGMAAAYAASFGPVPVLLLEQNEKLGKKVYISGKGRCNCTNAADMETVRNAVVTNPKFLYSAFSAFSNEDLVAFLERNGCPTKTERGSRVFPVSDHASDVIRTFERVLRQNGVEIHFHAKVLKLRIETQGKGRVCTGVVLTSGEVIPASAVILATGGISYVSTGSDGSGYCVAEEAGHSIETPRPALVGLNTAEDWVRELSGLSLRNIAVRFYREKKHRLIYDDFGELLFTHTGVSGPVILSASSKLTKYLPAPSFSPGTVYRPKEHGYGDGQEGSASEKILLEIDLKPALTAEQLDARILRDFSEEKNKRFKNALPGLLPASLIPVVVALSGVDPEKPVNSVTKEERGRLTALLKALPLTIVSTGGFHEAIVTQGGIRVKEIDPRTMESKLVRGLYFAGEIIDIDALTGGFNLQIAWSTGYLAGKSAAEKEKKMTINVAIDGPAGAGKSSVAKRIAQKMNYIYVDIGAMYRAIGLYFLKNGIDIHDEDACTAALPDISVTIGYENGMQQVYLNGENVSGQIRTQEVGEAASKTSTYSAVRTKLLDLQRNLAKENDVLMDGRDIGTMILPNANVKIFLTASSYVRAKRRFDELQAKGQPCVFEEIQKEIEERDYRDMHREIAPLKKADDAIEVDTSDLSIDEVVETIISIIREKTA
ncbi:MAG: (d)CMP kinase [Lachnospiraceae bacterium]|nr:(d)CMP kinase [Lachnospiraceae bacterium]